MKKAFKSLGLALLATAMLVGCSDDDTPSTPTPILNLEDGVMNGRLTEDYELVASKQYSLTGSFVIEDGVTLTIPAGTNIIADDKGTDVYIAVMMGGKIDIKGTADQPVIMTSSDEKPGDWGGLTICGKATTTSGANSTAEVGGFVYGGTNNADNSGSINYLVIKGTGAQINSESQYNGVSFYAVGSGTSVKNVAVINGADDGVEFFGGAVSVENLFLKNNEDDAIDWTEGWNGTATNSYVEHTSGFSTVVEADGANQNPKLINLTAVSTVGGTALQFKKASGATITGLSLTGYSTSVEKTNTDQGSFTDISIEGADANPSNPYTAAATVDPSSWTWVDADVTEVVVLNGNVTTDLKLDASKAYRLTGSYIVKDGASLTIPAGTRIIAKAATDQTANTDLYIAVEMGGKIFINGTAEKPVIMSSDLGKPGDWGGLTICGKAATTSGANSTAEVGGFTYGGSTKDDNSGSINYLVIKGTGAQINSESQYNGISCYAVGSGTTIANVAVIDGADDGIEFFGGSVEVTNIYLENNEDDAVDWTEGWDGSIENTYISHTVSGFSTAFEADGANNNPRFTNVTAICDIDGVDTEGVALQFKKASGATIENLYLEGYSTSVQLKHPEQGNFADIQIDGADAQANGTYKGTKVDISSWTWISAN